MSLLAGMGAEKGSATQTVTSFLKNVWPCAFVHDQSIGAALVNAMAVPATDHAFVVEVLLGQGGRGETARCWSRVTLGHRTTNG
jgi:hypothetical protein